MREPISRPFRCPAGRPSATFLKPSMKPGWSVAMGWSRTPGSCGQHGRRATVRGGAAGRTARVAGCFPPSGRRALLARSEDPDAGGFGNAPKFPPSAVLEFLIRHAAVPSDTADAAKDMAGRALGAHGALGPARPARRRIRPLLGDGGLVRPALREDALRQCPTAPCLCTLGAVGGGRGLFSRRSGGCGGPDAQTGCWSRSECDARRAALSLPPWTPTPYLTAFITREPRICGLLWNPWPDALGADDGRAARHDEHWP